MHTFVPVHMHTQRNGSMCVRVSEFMQGHVCVEVSCKFKMPMQLNRIAHAAKHLERMFLLSFESLSLGLSVFIILAVWEQKDCLCLK